MFRSSELNIDCVEQNSFVPWDLHANVKIGSLILMLLQIKNPSKEVFYRGIYCCDYSIFLVTFSFIYCSFS